MLRTVNKPKKSSDSYGQQISKEPHSEDSYASLKTQLAIPAKKEMSQNSSLRNAVSLPVTAFDIQLDPRRIL